MPQSWILIPVHNRRELTLGCLRHLAALGALRSFQVLVIDDGSTDGTAEAIRREFPDVRTLAGDGQLWWTGAIARGMEEADRAGASAVVWLNDDCLPDAGALEQLLDRTAQDPAVITGASCRTETGAPVDSAFIGRARYSAPPTGETELAVDGLSGFCVAVPRRVWRAIEFPDAARFPHYYGDNAYTLRARQCGFSVLMLGAARARLVAYEERAHSVAHLFACLPANARNWSAVFISPRSPFRAATQWHYLRLRYGNAAGSLLALVRLARWQAAFIAEATGATGKSSTAP
jgi:GT2 family glycosyltransferase